MFLKTLTLKGFKSFADTTVLDFEPGVTVVVGPNGSGKSNVVDAIGWVLGAQAPSVVRSQKMDDVIFAGTVKRPALGRAEVALCIDNSDGLLPIEFTEVTLARTLFRSGDSEYSINGVPCRLMDIQDLLSDSGVGRQQHVIVGQGQIDAVLNARAEDRRLILEEAAGVLKFRKRKERAERRLAATEANLTRLQDLLREVRRGLRPLQRQAEAARRHGDLVAELRALQLFMAGRELTTLRRRLGDVGAARAEVTDDEALLRRHLAELDAAVVAAEGNLARTGGHDLGDALARVEALAERARGLVALVAERRRSLDRERGAAVDAAVVDTLEAEAARLRAELADGELASAELAPQVAELARAEGALVDARRSFEAEWADGVPTSTSRAAEARGELSALRAGVERGQVELGRARVRLAALAEKLVGVDGEGEHLCAQEAAARDAEPPLLAQLEAARSARAAAEEAAAAAEAALRDADAERHAWAARAEALALTLDEARARAGAQRLAEVQGVVGTLLDLIDVDPGWEAAVEAATGEALTAVVVESLDAARASLAALAAGGGPDAVGGAVLALVGHAGLTFPDSRSCAPHVGLPVRSLVRPTRPEVGPLLDAVLGSAVALDGTWETALDVALTHPEVVVVTRRGDRFGPTGWRIGGPAAAATGAALEDARRRARAAAEAAGEAEVSLRGARSLLGEARQAEATAARRLDENDARLTAATDGLARVAAQRSEVTEEAESLRGHVAELGARLERDQARVADLEALLPVYEAEEAGVAERARAMAAAREALERRAAEVASLRTDLEVRVAGLAERRDLLGRRLAEVEHRLGGSLEARRQAEGRRVELDRRQVALERLGSVLDRHVELLGAELSDLRERRLRQGEAQRAAAAHLEGLRAERAQAERRLEETRERARRAELEEAEVTLRLETAAEALRRNLEVEPEAAMAAPAPELPEGATPAARARELERELRLMGPINPLALEEYEALQDRHEFLQGQLDDVKSSRRELGRVIRAVDEEIASVFAAAFADVSENFEALFETLFPGGRGRLRLTDPDDLLNCGIEVEARPSGKNVRKLSLLSGGERSLTALAFLFAVFRSRPSPFYVMDEVEAALDDVNLRRFLDLVDEFRSEAQLIIVSHQKRTMEAADCLYGVTMQPGGSSKVVSEKTTAEISLWGR
jgi:chromosome segregation protein